MMNIDPSFLIVLARLRGGDQDAATEIFRRYVHKLTALASQHFSGQFRGKADPEDLVQSAYASFVRKDRLDPFELSDWDSLWNLLAFMTVRKCSTRRKFWKTGKRDVAREIQPTADGPLEPWWQAFDREATPLQALALDDMLKTVMNRLVERDRQALSLILEGHTKVEAAHLCGCTERTITRTIDRVKAILKGMDPETDLRG